MLISNGNENFVSPDGDSALWESSKMFLNGFVERTGAFSLEEEIKSQENTVQQSQKKLTALQQDETGLMDKITKYQDELSINRDNQKDEQKNTIKQAVHLENLRLKRKL